MQAAGNAQRHTLGIKPERIAVQDWLSLRCITERSQLRQHRPLRMRPRPRS